MIIDLSDIAGLRSRLRSYYAERNSLIQEMRDLRFMKHLPDVPAGLEPERVVTPLAYQLSEHMVGMLVTNDYKVRVPPAAETQTARDQSDNLEKWILAALHQLQRQQDEDVLERFVESLVCDGHGCMRILYAPQYWRGYPKQDKKNKENDKDYSKRAEEWTKAQPIPISWNWIDPLNVFPLWDERGLACVMETDKRDIITLDAKKFNKINSQPELEELCRTTSIGSGQVEFTQLWTRDELIYCIGDEIVHRTKNKYRSIPYIYAMGQTISSKAPGEQGLSMLYPMRYILPYLDRLLSQKASAVRLWCWPTPVLESAIGAPVGNDQRPSTLQIKPGKTVELYAGEKLSFLTWQGNGPDIDEMIALVSQMAERAGLADSLFGTNPGGDSGYAINQLISAARVKFKPIIQHAERAMEQVIATLLDIIEYQIQQPLHIYQRGSSAGWITIKPEDIKGYRQIEFELDPVIPTDEYARSSKAINEVRAGLRSIASGMEQIGIGQPGDMQDEILIDTWKRSPQVQQVLIQAAVKKWGLIQEQRQNVPMQELIQLLPQLPPALQQAIAMNIQGQNAPSQVGLSQPGPNIAGMPPSAVMAAPGVQANPAAPSPNLATQIGHVGPVTQPSGIATGKAPGVKMRGQEG